MKLSKMIKELQDAYDQFGDMTVYTYKEATEQYNADYTELSTIEVLFVTEPASEPKLSVSIE